MILVKKRREESCIASRLPPLGKPLIQEASAKSNQHFIYEAVTILATSFQQ
jgi:hypothetical protein